MAAGYRGLLAPWIGGAGAVVPADGGPRSLLAFWIGGAGAQVDAEPPPPPAPPPPLVGSRPRFRYPVPADLQALNRARLIDDDELLLLMAAQIAAAGLLH